MQNFQQNRASSSLIEKFVNKFRKEGVDHIRVSARADTHLGRICSPDWQKPFFIPYIGEFLSAECFANWIISGGDEEARHNPRYRTRGNLQLHRNLVMYAKYFQLSSVKSSFRNRKEEMAMPFAMYNLHPNGIKEFSPWKEYASAVKEFVNFITENGSKAVFDWESLIPGIEQLVKDRVAAIAELYKSDDEEDIPANDESQDDQEESVDNEQVVDEAEPQQEVVTAAA